jgi:hypothetical protein
MTPMRMDDSNAAGIGPKDSAWRNTSAHVPHEQAERATAAYGARERARDRRDDAGTFTMTSSWP